MNPPEFIRGLHNLGSHHRGCVATIGSFDGVHRGHQAVLAQVVEQANVLRLPSLVMVFEPQPHEYFARESAPARLMRLREKVDGLFAFGINRVLCLKFNKALRTLSANAYIQRVLVEGIGVRHLVIGDDFRFGCDRAGDFAMLCAAGKSHGFSVADTCTQNSDGERISSTRIRALLGAGDFAAAASLLGRRYSIRGRVLYGQKLGHRLGFPTANVGLGRYFSPVSGVFAVKVKVAGGEHLGVANVGVRPTVGGRSKPILEVHLLDFDGEIYGQFIETAFIERIRGEQKFASLNELQKQIAKDIVSARKIFQRAWQ